MPDVSLYEINRTIGSLITAVEGLQRGLSEDRHVSSDHRQGIREELSKLLMRQTHLESDMASVKHKLDQHERVTIAVTTLRDKAEGAGTAGRWAIRIGIAIVSLLGWLAATYTAMTGRPPP